MSTQEFVVNHAGEINESPLNLLWFHTAPSGPGSRLQSEIVPESLPIFEQAPVGIAILDLHFVITRANRAFSRLLNMPIHRLERCSPCEFTHPEDVDSDARNRRALANHDIESFSVVKRMLRGDGTVRCVKLSYSRIHSAFSGSGFLLCADDVTTDFESSADQ